MILIILAIILLVEFSFKPRLDWTYDDKLLIWYGITDRNYIVLIK